MKKNFTESDVEIVESMIYDNFGKVDVELEDIETINVYIYGELLNQFSLIDGDVTFDCYFCWIGDLCARIASELEKR